METPHVDFHALYFPACVHIACINIEVSRKTFAQGWILSWIPGHLNRFLAGSVLKNKYLTISALIRSINKRIAL